MLVSQAVTFLADDYLTVYDAARMLGVSHFTVRRLVARGWLHAYLSKGAIGRYGQLLVSRADIEALFVQPVQ